jgi:dihydroorotase
LILKLKKESSSGVDSISAKHQQLTGSLMEQHLALLFQMILVCGEVPLQFCVGQITPILKKSKKDPSLCSSYHPITV